jgi:hypothetical protein
MAAAGLDQLDLLAAAYAPETFGNAEAVFRAGTLVLKFMRDRGQDFLYLAAANAPDQFHPSDDVEVALGWRTLDDVLAQERVEPIGEVVGLIGARFAELQARFSAAEVERTVCEIERASAALRAVSFAKLTAKRSS